MAIAVQRSSTKVECSKVRSFVPLFRRIDDNRKYFCSNPQDAEIPTERLPKVSYGTMKLTALRKLLMEKGLSNTGDKDELVARYDRFVALNGAECFR